MGKMNKFKDKFRTFTDNIGLTYGDEDDFQDHLIDEEDDEHEENIVVQNYKEVPKEPVHTYEPTRATFIPKQETVNHRDENASCQTIFVNIKSFSECKKIANYIKEDKVVTLNLENVNNKEAQRILDFLSGAISIKEAKWVPISSKVFTSVPKNIQFVYDGKDVKDNALLNIEQD